MNYQESGSQGGQSHFSGNSYEILNSEADMPLSAQVPLLFLSTFVSRTHMLASLLAEMDQAGLIRQDQVHLGAKAVKMIYTGWPYNSDDERIRRVVVQEQRGRQRVFFTSESVHSVTTLSPESPEKARQVASHLLEHGTVAGPWKNRQGELVLDLRATAVLEGTLKPLGFRKITANIQEDAQGGQLVVFSRQQRISTRMKAAPILVNRNLARLLVP